QDQARPLGLRREASQPERHGALVLLEDVDPLEDEEQQDESRERAPGKSQSLVHETLRSTRSFKPSTPTTRTFSPAGAPGAPEAPQSSRFRVRAPGWSLSPEPRTPLASPPRRLTEPVRTGARRSEIVRKVRNPRTASVIKTAGSTIPRSTR